MFWIDFNNFYKIFDLYVGMSCSLKNGIEMVYVDYRNIEKVSK